jgi:hypothetical protein
VDEEEFKDDVQGTNSGVIYAYIAGAKEAGTSSSSSSSAATAGNAVVAAAQQQLQLQQLAEVYVGGSTMSSMLARLLAFSYPFFEQEENDKRHHDIDNFAGVELVRFAGSMCADKELQKFFLFALESVALLAVYEAQEAQLLMALNACWLGSSGGVGGSAFTSDQRSAGGTNSVAVAGQWSDTLGRDAMSMEDRGLASVEGAGKSSKRLGRNAMSMEGRTSLGGLASVAGAGKESKKLGRKAMSMSERGVSGARKRKGKPNGARGGKRVRVSKDGKKRKTMVISALPADTEVQEARVHFAKLGLSAVNPLGRCVGCLRLNLCFPVFEDDRSRASGYRQHTLRTGATTVHCGLFKKV